MGHSYIVRPGKGFGAAEGVYLLPLLYPSFGYALYLLARKPFRLVVAFMVISLAALVYETDFHNIFLGVRAETKLHNNTIHSANVSGIMMICAVAFANYLLHARDIDVKIRNVLLVAAAGVVTLAGLNVFGLQSKGVWLALIVSLPPLFAMTALDGRNRYGKVIAFAVLVGVFVGIGLFGNNIREVGENTMANAASFVSKVVHGENLASLTSATVNDLNTEFKRQLTLDELVKCGGGLAKAAAVWFRHCLAGQLAKPAVLGFRNLRCCIMAILRLRCDTALRDWSFTLGFSSGPLEPFARL